MDTDEIKEQMELCDSEDRQLLTEEELSSHQNISHNSDNGYLYQDADFLCGAIIKTRKALAERNRLIAKHEWVENPNYRYAFICSECKSETGQLALSLEKAKEKYPDEFIHAPDCAIAAALKGIKADISWEKGVGE